MLQYFNNIITILLPLCIIMILMFIIDTITGVIKAKKLNTFCSNKLRAGIPKFIIYFCFVLVCLCIDFITIYYLQNVEIPFLSSLNKVFNHYPVTLACMLFIIYVEIVSIIENGKEAGAQIPPYLTKIIESIKTKITK